MDINFDKFGDYEIPNLTLTNPNKEEIYSLKLAYDTNMVIRFNALSEFSFKFPKSINAMETIIEAYDYIQNKRLVKIEGYGYYIISNAVEDLTGAVPVKNVSCESLEADLIQKRVTAYGGTKPLYNIFNPTNTVLGDMISLIPTWSIGDIDSSLLIKYRTFNVSDTNVYNFLMNDVSKAFECVFFFDSETKTISVKATESSTINTDIFMSFDNLINKASFSEKSDEIVTCLSVYGGGDLSIRGVNPLGTDSIYDFSYYANTEWMSQGLVDAIGLWQAAIDTNQTDYSESLLLLKQYNGEMLILEGDLDTLTSQYLALEGIQKVRIEAGQTYADITSQMVSKQSEINSKNILIDNKQLQINTVTSLLQAINSSVSFSNNFTPSQLLELNNFIYQNTFKNENIIQTDNMTDVQIQDAQQDLYEKGLVVLSRISQPRYEISMDAVNYLALEEFSVFSSQTELGSVVTAEIHPDQFVSTILLEISFTFDDPTNFSMLFSNRVRIDGSGFVYSDLQNEVVKTGSSVSFDNLKWSNWENNYKDDVSTFITSALDTTTNNLINNSNQEILINQNGLRGRTYNSSTGGYNPTQVWLTSSVLAFTDNAFQTSKLALGKVTVNGVSQFGLIADTIVGRLLAGNTLTITNSGNNFVLDQTGATLTNAKFSVQTTNTKIIIDPTQTICFNIQQNIGGTWTNKFWIDNTGNVNFTGILSGASGTFTGSITATSGSIGGIGINSIIPGLSTGGIYKISDPSHYYIGSNGNLVWGAISVIGGTTVFNGNLRADKLFGTINWNQVTGVPPANILSGTAKDVDLSWNDGNINIYTGGYGWSLIEASRLDISAGGTSIGLDGGLITMSAEVVILTNENGHIEINGGIYTANPEGDSYPGFGINRRIIISTTLGYRYMEVNNGIITAYYQ